MERAVAIKKLSAILGKSFRYRVDAKAPSREEREEAQAKLREEQPKRADLEKRMEARRVEILAGDVEYQRLKSEHAAAKTVCNELLGTTMRYRFTVGTVPGGLFFHVKAQGDSWEDVIAQLTKKAAA